MNHILEQRGTIDFNVVLLQRAIESNDKHIINIYKSITKVISDDQFVIGATVFSYNRKTHRWDKSIYTETQQLNEEFFISINKNLNQIINMRSLNVCSSFKDIHANNLHMILNDAVAEINNQLAKHKTGAHQIQVDLKKHLDINLQVSDQEEGNKNKMNKRVVCLCLLLNLLTQSTKYIYIRA